MSAVSGRQIRNWHDFVSGNGSSNENERSFLTKRARRALAAAACDGEAESTLGEVRVPPSSRLYHRDSSTGSTLRLSWVHSFIDYDEREPYVNDAVAIPVKGVCTPSLVCVPHLHVVSAENANIARISQDRSSATCF